MLLLGAEGRNAGKTGFACSVIGRFSRDFPIVGVKVTTVEGRRDYCPRGGKGCGACRSLEGPFCIQEETGRASGKDTTRMLASGAAKVFWARSRSDSLHECLAALRERIGAGPLVVAESNSLARVVDPALFLMLRERDGTAPKPSARAVQPYVDCVVLCDHGVFDPDPGDLAVRDNVWQLLDASAVILTEGQGRRGETQTVYARVPGASLIENEIEELRGRFREILIATDHPALYRHAGLPLILGGDPCRDALGVIASALEAAQSDIVFITPAGFRDIDRRVLRRLLAAARRSDCALARRPDGMIEPLFAAWRQSALPAIREARAGGKRQVAAVLASLQVVGVDAGTGPGGVSRLGDDPSAES
jgi:molybdopterin-guanine dinucleotide biosynthesis protein A